MWTVSPNAWPAVVDEETFERAQQRFANQTFFKTNDQLIAELKRLMEKKGRLSERDVLAEPDLPAQGAYRNRFGSMSQAFALAGYVSCKLKGMKTRRNRRQLRDDLIKDVIGSSEGRISVIQPDGHWRPRLRLPNGLAISIYLCPWLRNESGEERWVLNTIPRERRFVSLVARLNPSGDGFVDFFLLPHLRGRVRWTLAPDDIGLQCGQKLGALSELEEVAREVRNSQKGTK